METDIKQLFQAGFDMNNLSIMGKGFHTEEKFVGFCNIRDLMKFWGLNGCFWGSFFGGVILTLPGTKHVIILGYLAVMLVFAVEGAALIGGFSALGAVIYSIEIPRDSVVQYKIDTKADGFLVMVHGSVAKMKQAKAILGITEPSNIEIYSGNKNNVPLTTNLAAAGQKTKFISAGY